ncbi:MAG TPA: hypothetical protein VFT72_07610 [Opitutaceae bacterium]|nr:hypothetical protein [Opitutaceae bacterium]
MFTPFEFRNGGKLRRFALCAGVAGVVVFGGCWQKTRVVHGVVRVSGNSGAPVAFDSIELAAYPKSVARNTFAQASVVLGKRYSSLRDEVLRASDEEAQANSVEGLSPAEEAVFKELRHLLELSDTMRGDRDAREEIEQRIIELKEAAKTAGKTRVVARFEKLAASHEQNVNGFDELRHSAPKIGMLMLQQLPETEYRTQANADGEFTMRIPAEEPYVLSAIGRVKTRGGTDYYCWIVPVKLALGSDVVVDLTNENLFTDLNRTKRVVGLSRER